jgi:hypothetical protein
MQHEAIGFRYAFGVEEITQRMERGIVGCCVVKETSA